MTIGGRRVGGGEPCFVVAEAGVNHNGEVELARRLVDAAAAAGADAIKFQTFRAEGVAAADAPKAGYQLETTDGDESQLEMLRRLELDRDAFAELKARAEERGLAFLSTPFDVASVDLLDGLGVAAFKVASPDLTNLPLLEEIARRGRPVILSTGLADLDEVEAAVDAVRAAARASWSCCTACRSTPRGPRTRISEQWRRWRSGSGCRSATRTTPRARRSALAAVALGACMLEKHVTLDRSLPGPDHRASLEPEELAALVRAVRRVEAALGDGVKAPTAAERRNAAVVRRSLAAAADLPAGAELTREMLTALRPGTGIPPARIDEVVGRHLRRDLVARRAPRPGRPGMRTIGVVTVARSDYGIYRPVLRALAERDDISLQLYVGGMHLLERFGSTVEEIERDGFPIAERVDFLLPEDTPQAVAESIGRGVVAFAEAFSRTRPDLLLVLGDRFEMFAAGIAALPLALPVAHIHGGELTEGADRRGDPPLAHEAQPPPFRLDGGSMRAASSSSARSPGASSSAARPPWTCSRTSSRCRPRSSPRDRRPPARADPARHLPPGHARPRTDRRRSRGDARCDRGVRAGRRAHLSERRHEPRRGGRARSSGSRPETSATRSCEASARTPTSRS